MTTGKNRLFCPLDIKLMRPLPALALAAVAGCFLGSTAGNLSRTLFLGTVLSAAFIMMVNIQPGWLAVAIPLAFMATTIHAGIVLDRAGLLATQIDGESRILTGHVAAVPEQTDHLIRVIVRSPDGSRVLLSCPKSFSKPQYGDLIEIEVYFEHPRRKRNPGGFDESAWLAGQGIFVKARPADDSIRVISRSASVLNLAEIGISGRAALIRLMKNLLAHDQASLLGGLLLGDTRAISQQTRSDFRRAGLIHLMSVSGTHVTFLLMPASRLLQSSHLGRKWRFVILLLLLVVFGFLTGWRTSVTRAILMAGCVLAGRLLHRPADSISALALAALIILNMQPLVVVSTGFWMSLSATAALVILAAPLQEKIRMTLHWIPTPIIGPLSAGLSIHLGLMPLLAGISREVSLVGVISNLPAGFLAAAICLLATTLLPIAGLIGLALPAIGSVLASPLGLSVDLLAMLASQAGKIQAGRLPAGALNPAFWLIWLIFMILWGCRLIAPQLKSRAFYRLISRLQRPAVAIWLLATGICWFIQPAVQVWFLDVGQGDAILIKSRNGESMLIDGGNSGQGWYVILPALDELGIDQLDVIIATHGHSDHAGGLLDVLAAGRAKHLMLSGSEWEAVRSGVTGQSTAILADLMDAAQLRGIQVSELTGNDTITLGQMISMKVINLHADPEIPLVQGYDANSSSLILDVQLASCRVLLTGDCTLELEGQLLGENRFDPADVLKVAHHGSRYATTKAFLDVVLPRDAVISVGRNFYGHPSADTLQRLDEAGCTVWRTDESGAIHLRIGRQDWAMAPAYP